MGILAVLQERKAYLLVHKLKSIALRITWA